jgi:hypothetical protein
MGVQGLSIAKVRVMVNTSWGAMSGSVVELRAQGTGVAGMESASFTSHRLQVSVMSRGDVIDDKSTGIPKSNAHEASHCGQTFLLVRHDTHKDPSFILSYDLRFSSMVSTEQDSNCYWIWRAECWLCSYAICTE